MISPEVGHIDPHELRAADRFYFQPPTRLLVDASISLAGYQFRIDLDGRLILAFWVVPEVYPGPRRGWAQMVFGSAVDDVPVARWGRQALRFHAAVMAARPFDVLRSWVAADDARATRFAKWMGFRYDAGPASDILPDGRDANLHIWRAGNVDVRRGRSGRSGRSKGGGGPAGWGSPHAAPEGRRGRGP